MKLEKMESFSSQTKLMLTGEYAVLKGALSLALPLKFTQNLSISTSPGDQKLIWKSLIGNDLWFKNILLLPDFQVIETNNPELTVTLSQILANAKNLNPDFLTGHDEFEVTSIMDFNPLWGIGSSSSLISNIAFWANCDPFELNDMIFNGSGYDIACARSSSPIVYQIEDNKPSFRVSKFNPVFKDKLYFVYLNRKQNSKESVLKSDISGIKQNQILALSELTLDFEASNELEEFQFLMEKHEEIIADIIQIKPVKSLLFNDFKGSIKSLGAWGGDFILVASNATEEYVRDYFMKRELNTIFRFEEIVKQ